MTYEILPRSHNSHRGQRRLLRRSTSLVLCLSTYCGVLLELVHTKWDGSPLTEGLYLPLCHCTYKTHCKCSILRVTNPGDQLLAGL